MTTPSDGPRVHSFCRVLSTGMDRWGLTELRVDCPLRATRPDLETCLDCPAFVAIGTHQRELHVECVPAESPLADRMQPIVRSRDASNGDDDTEEDDLPEPSAAATSPSAPDEETALLVRRR